MDKNKQELAIKLDVTVANVFTENQVLGFQKAFLVASAIEELKALLTTDYMKPIMAMQGNRLGFKTDKDKTGGYGMDVVKNCLIEAVLMGLQPTGNQFNIIAGNTYATKEGVGDLLKKIDGLVYKIKFELPRVNNEKTGAAIKAIINFTYKGKRQEETLDLPIKMDAYTSTDAIIGKATRKARKWLFDYITGTELPEGETEDISFELVDDKASGVNAKKEQMRNSQQSEQKDGHTKANDATQNGGENGTLFDGNKEMP